MMNMTDQSVRKLTHRLPTTVIPSHYQLYIDASQLEQYLFQGKVDIDIQTTEISYEIRLNSFDLNLTKVEYQQKTPISQLFNGSVEFNKEYEQVSIRFAEQIKPGTGCLHIEFNGTINGQLNGFYRTKDNNQIGACTQFEPAYARQAFPCFDEPALKAKFTISIRASKHLTTLSNMPIKSHRNDGAHTCIYDFDTTPIMSTYLVAYVIGAYDYIEAHDSNNVQIRVYTPVGKKERGLFALHTTAKVLPFFAEYFGVKYPLSKLDMIAVADFGYGAMENWGLITYHETYLLVDPHTTTQETKQELALTVAHELAHQWFGNLVTMEWWNDLWLNEDKFASWIQFLAVDHVYPEYDIWTQFVSDTLETCMIPDALHNSHPIEMPIEKPTDIDEIFDSITYEKGSSVIRFLHAYIGDEAFRTGLANYLAEYAYKNAITENLWSHLSRTSKRPELSEILSTWTKQIGYPVLTVTQEQKGNHRLITIEQTRFLADGTTDDNLKWKIPINICTKSNPTEHVHQLYMNGEKKQEFLLEKLSESDWIKLNLFSVGIYRVNYSQCMLDALVPCIQDHTFSPQDRFGIQADVYELARSGHVGYVDYLKLLRHAYKHEDNLTVWKSILQKLDDLNSILAYAHLDNIKKLFRTFICEILSNIYGKLEWDPFPNEGSQAAMLRELVLVQMGLNGHSKTREEAHKRFQTLLSSNDQDHQSINPNIRTAIYLTVAQTGNQETFEQFKALYRKSDAQEEKIRLLMALCSFDDETIQYQALEYIWNENEVRKQDHKTAFVALATHNCKGCEIAWKYLQDNWNKIEETYGEHDAHLIKFIEDVPNHFVTKDREEEVQKFYVDHPNPLLDRSIKKVLELINIRRTILERDEHNIHQFLTTSCAGTTWESNGKTVAGGNGPGSALNQLNSSYGIVVDSNNALFVSDYSNHRVIKWEQGASHGSLHIGELCGTNTNEEFCYPSAITFNKEGTLFVTVQSDSIGSVVFLKKGAASFETLITVNTSIYGIVWDQNEEYLYLGHHREHRVLKYTKDGKFVSVVAGGNGAGSALDQLDYRDKNIQKSHVPL
ncbi:unnamed protein product [Rotaria socialis]|uniref:Puromycin-sensitive aminopeptidase n=3 Tax=Rotaria socialis TaxID=392032 RepID=A0A820FNF9_9BILA|nr:unnamed protein product [Rotaria socialis]CAF4264833.1 unnamed protein product [Rotaria socialis]